MLGRCHQTFGKGVYNGWVRYGVGGHHTTSTSHQHTIKALATSNVYRSTRLARATSLSHHNTKHQQQSQCHPTSSPPSPPAQRLTTRASTPHTRQLTAPACLRAPLPLPHPHLARPRPPPSPRSNPSATLLRPGMPSRSTTKR